MKNLKLVFITCIILTLICLAYLPVIASTEKVEIVFQHNNTEDHPWQDGALYVQKVLDERSNGRIKVKIYPYGILSQRNWKVMLEQTQKGSTQMMIESSIPFATLIPELFALNLPFSFENVDHYKKFMKNPPDVVLEWFKKLEEKDVKVIGVWTRPFRQIINSERPIKTPEDLKGLKFRVPGLDLFVKTWEAMGTKPIPLSSGEIYTAIQLGTVVGEDNSINSVYSLKTYEVTKYMTIWDYMPDGVLVVVNKPFWDKLSEEDQNLILEAVDEGREVVYKGDKEYEKVAMTEMIESGIQFAFLTEKQKEPFKELVKPAYKIMEEIVGKANLEAYLLAVGAAR
jgi:C4-dicarboxylate-binding protein DctP